MTLINLGAGPPAAMTQVNGGGGPPTSHARISSPPTASTLLHVMAARRPL